MTRPLDASRSRPETGGASFSLANRAGRALFMLVWTFAARWTPPPLHGWRRLILTAFGADLHPTARVHASARIWHPANLSMGAHSLIGPGAICYNQGRVTIGAGVVVSQRAHLCASSHDLRSAHFQLVLRPIVLDDGCWVAAEAFVGPGVTVGARAVIGARAVLFTDAEPNGIYRGNPAERLAFRSGARDDG